MNSQIETQGDIIIIIQEKSPSKERSFSTISRMDRSIFRFWVCEDRQAFLTSELQLTRKWATIRER
jgi:hypothetical protein